MNTLLRQTSAKHATWHVAARKLSQHPLLLMLGFALGYYLAGRIGLMLRLPPLEISVIWPANAVLLAALMLLPPSRWWLVFLALVPAQLALQAPLGTPAWRIFSQIATNSLLGLGIAAMVLRFTNNAGTFTTLRYTLIYLAVVIIWPALIALISAAVVLWSGAATDFWLSWRQTWLSNTLSFLALVPALVLGLAHGLWLRPGSWRRIAEAVMLFVGLVLLAGFAFAADATKQGFYGWSLYLPLPLLIFAAVRFGPAGTSIITTLALVLSILYTLASDPFQGTMPRNAMFNLQLFYLAFAPTLLCIAALVRERERAATVLQQVNHELEQRVSTRTASLLQANVLLEQRVSDLASLNRITESLVLWPNMPEALEVVGATIQKLFEAVHVVVWQVEGNRLAAMPLVPHATQTQIPALQIADDAVATCVINGKTMVLVAGAAAPAFFKHHVHSDGVLTGDVILVPLADYSQNNGLLMIGPARPPRVYSPTDITLAQTIASALAGTLQNLRLLRETQYQHAVSEALRDVLSALVEKVDLPTMLRSLLTQLGRVIHYDSAAIFLHQATDLVIVDGRGAAENFRGQRLPLDFDHPAGRVFHARAPLVVADAAILEEWTVWRGCSRSWAGVPLLHMGVAIGVLTLAREQPSAVSQDDIRLLEAFANQATIAIYNAQRYRLAETVATDRERRRIAREVHDSVNQTLFAAHAAATMLPLVYAREPAAGEQTLAELQQLIGMAQIEMRSLLYELRPSILSMNPLSDLLVALAHSTQTKLRVEAGISLDQTPLLPAEAQIALYRIAQEALHNIFKHARPTTIRFSLTLAPPFEVTQTQPWQGLLTLVIEDDGGGFESAVPTSGIGLTSMRERAKGIGAELSIVSRSGAGTSIRATWRGSARIV